MNVNICAEIRDNGFSISKEAVSVAKTLEPLKKHYVDVVDTLILQTAGCYLTDNGVIELLESTLRTKIVTLIAIHGQSFTDHFDPFINSQFFTYQFNSNWKSSFGAASVNLIRDEKIIDLIRPVLGGNLVAFPIHSFLFKLSESDIDRVFELRKEYGFRAKLDCDMAWRYHYESSNWFNLSSLGLANSYNTDCIGAWVVLNGLEDNMLSVLPGSHKHEKRREPFRQERKEKVDIRAGAGDVVLVDSKCFQKTLRNASDSNEKWMVGCLYFKYGDPSPRPELPQFIVHSETYPALTNKNPSLCTEIYENGMRKFNDRGRRLLKPSITDDSNKRGKTWITENISMDRSISIWSKYKQHTLDPKLWIKNT